MKISSDNSQEYFKNPTSNETLHTRRNLESVPSVPSVPRFRTPTSSPNNKRKSPVIPAAKTRESPASSPVKAENMEYSYWSSQSYTYKTNPIIYGTYQETEPNYNNSTITTQRLQLRKSTLQEYPNKTQSSNTLQHINIQPSQCCHIQFRKCLQCPEVLNILFNAHNNNTLWRLTPCAHAEANIPGEYPRIFLTGITA